MIRRFISAIWQLFFPPQPAEEDSRSGPRPIRPSDRDIFEFFDGEKMRAIDPLEAWRTLWEKDGHLLMDRIASADAGDWQSIDELIDLACRMFGVRRYEDGNGGLTMDEINSLLSQYLTWMQRIKKKRDLLQMQLERMGLGSNSATANSTTKTESDSSSTPSESKSDEPQKPSMRSFVHSGPKGV